MNLLCCICTELLYASSDVLSTPCGHLYHNQCVHQWLVRSKTCPQCRFACDPHTLHKIYFNIGLSNASFTETSVLQRQHDIKLENSQILKQIKELESKYATERLEKIKIIKKYHSAQEINQSSQFLVNLLREQLRVLERENDRYKELQEQLNKANAKLETVKLTQQVIDESAQEVEDIINRSETNVTTLAVLVTSLKAAFASSEETRKQISSYLQNSQNECERKEEELRKLRKAFDQLKDKNKRLNDEIVNSRINATGIIDENAVLHAPVEHQLARTIKQSNTTGPICGCDSPTTHDIQIIKEPTSPYLHVKSSSVGLAPLQLRGPSNLIAPAKSNPLNLQIFKRPRLTDSNFQNMRSVSALGNIDLNGFGSSNFRKYRKMYPKKKVQP